MTIVDAARRYQIALNHRDRCEEKLAEWCRLNAYAVTGALLHGIPLTSPKRNQLQRLSQKAAAAQLDLATAHTETALVSGLAKSET